MRETSARLLGEHGSMPGMRAALDAGLDPQRCRETLRDGRIAQRRSGLPRTRA